jgi:beta-lactamase regulating signal transducer with metallopeptidase domain
MNLLTRLYPGDAVCILVASILVQIAIVALLATVASRIVARRNAALRHCILLSALLWIPVSPVAAWRLSRSGLLEFKVRSGETIVSKVEAAQGVDVERSAKVADSVGGVDELVGATSVSPPPAAARVDYVRPWVSVAIIVWLSGLVVMLVRVGHGLRGVSRIRGQCRRAGAAVELVLVDILRSVAGAGHPSVLVSEVIRGPVTVGVRRPVIILPGELVKEISDARMREILIHECIHASRGDYAIGIFQRLIAAVFWFHPMVHLLNRDLSRAREEVCDNAVLRAGKATDYARTLLELGKRLGAQKTPRLVPGLFDRSWRLEERVAGILNQRRVVMTRVRMRSRVAIVVGVVFAGLALSALSPTRGQSKVENRGEKTLPALPLPATESSAAPATAAAGGADQTVGTLLDRGPNFVSPEEEAVRAAQEQRQLAVSKANLALQEAEIKLKQARLDLDRKQELYTRNAVSVGEVEESRLAVQLGEVQVEKAKVEVEAARAAAVPTRMVGLMVRDGGHSESDSYNVHASMPIRLFLERHFKQALDGGWDITLIRRGNGQSHVMLIGVRKLSEKPIGVQGQNLQAGDQVLVRRDIVRVLKGPGMNSPVIWESALEGKKMSVPEVLKEAGVQFGAEDRNRVLLQGWRVGGQKSWTGSLSAIANGFGDKEVVEPSDVLVLNWQ